MAIVAWAFKRGMVGMRRLVVLLAACGALAGPAAAETREQAMVRGGKLIDQSTAAFETDKAKARALMEEAAATGNPEAINGLANYISHGVGGPEDPGKARQLYEQAVAGGSIGARLNLGRILVQEQDKAGQGRGVKLLNEAYADPKARKYAAIPLGIAYLFGAGVERDVKRGVDLLEEAGDQVQYDGQAEYLLGRTYQSGWGGRSPDPDKSYRHFRRCAELDGGRCGWEVGMAYLAGEAVPKDTAEAYRWVRKAAEAGDERGQISLGVMLATGEGVAENDVESRAWYLKAAEQGSSHALRELGGMYFNGEGGAADEIAGLAYIELSADAGDEAAGRAMKKLGAEIKPADRARMDAIKRDWIAAHGAPRVDN
jgi:TPR repeat protein